MDKERLQQLCERAYRLGFDYEREYRGCAQCAVAALQDALQVRNPQTDAVFKAATALSGGAAGEGDGQCGAYSGSILMLGTFIGRERDDFQDPRRVRHITQRMAGKLHGRFIEEYGSVVCQTMHRRLFGRPFYLRDADEMRKFDEAGAHTRVCTHVVGLAARWTVEILADEGCLEKLSGG